MRQRGQAATELAVILPIMFIMFFGFIALLVYYEAYVEVKAATTSAAAAAASAPRGRVDPTTGATLSREWADVSYQGSLAGYDYLVVSGGDLGLDRSANFRCERDRLNPANQQIECHGRAAVRVDQTPLVLIGVHNLTVDAFATAYAPLYRSR
ncbi:MAG: TadE family protein [Candidatus Dormibacteria bacterium]